MFSTSDFSPFCLGRIIYFPSTLYLKPLRRIQNRCFRSRKKVRCISDKASSRRKKSQLHKKFLPLDVILLVTNVHELTPIYRQKDKKKILKRDLDVLGFKSEKILLTLWEKLATNEGELLADMKDTNPIILLKSVIGKYYNGFTLSTTSSSSLEINPDIIEAKEIKEWFSNNKLSLTSPLNHAYLLTTLLQINSCDHSFNEIKYYDIKVSIQGFKEGALWYDACNICKSKVFLNDGHVECSKCSKKNIDHTLRYLIRLDVEDSTACVVLTLFDVEATEFIGIPVLKLSQMKESNAAEYNNYLKKFIGSNHIFSIKSQDKMFGSRSIRTLTVMALRDDVDKDALNGSKKIKLEGDLN